MHVSFGLVGGYIGYNYEKWELQLLDAINEKRKEKGYPQISRENVAVFDIFQKE